VEEAELVAFGVAEYLPAASCADVGSGRAERHGLVDRGGEIAGAQVQVQAVLDGLALEDAQEVDRQALRRAQRGVAAVVVRGSAASTGLRERVGPARQTVSDATVRWPSPSSGVT